MRCFILIRSRGAARQGGGAAPQRQPLRACRLQVVLVVELAARQRRAKIGGYAHVLPALVGKVPAAVVGLLWRCSGALLVPCPALLVCGYPPSVVEGGGCRRLLNLIT